MTKLRRNLTRAASLGPEVTAVAAHGQDGSVPKLAAVVSEYAKAWASRDPDRITALHTEDSEFALNVSGVKHAIGRAAIRAQFAKILKDNPAYVATTRSVDFGEDFVVIEYSFKMKPPRALDLGSRGYTTDEASFEVPAIDVIHFKDGLVTAKHTYIDSETIRDHSKAVKPFVPKK